MSFDIKPATRQGVKPLVGFYGRSGSGKTMSALLFALIEGWSAVETELWMISKP